MTNRTLGKAACVPGRLLGRLKTLAFSSLSGTSKQVPSMTTIRSPLRNAPKVSVVAIGRTNLWNNWLITLAPNRCRAWVIADLQGTRQYLPTFTHVSDKPSMRFLSTSRIESLDQRLIAISKQTTNCAGNDRFLSSLALLVTMASSIAVVGIASSIAFSKSLLCIVGDNSEKSLRCATLNCHGWE